MEREGGRGAGIKGGRRGAEKGEVRQMRMWTTDPKGIRHYRRIASHLLNGCEPRELFLPLKKTESSWE